MVYHYTTIETFYNMLATYKGSDDKYHLEFWASSILNQNDKEELSITAEDIMPVMKEIEKSIKKTLLTDLKKLSTIDNQWWVPTLTGQNVKENMNEFFQNKYNIPYTISFSQNEDKLLMWAMYANNGNGVCLAFDENMIVNCNTYKFAVSDLVQYKKDSQYYKEIIKQYYDLYIQELGDENVINIIYQLKRRYWACILMGISPFFKNKAFEDEAEYRITYYVAGENIPPVFTRLTNRLNIINYIKVKIPLDALKYIIIGPCADFAHTKSLLIENMKVNGIVRDYDDGNFIRTSNVPYRSY